MSPGTFDSLFTNNVPHIPEQIFLSLDYESYKASMRVSNAWNELLTSELFQRKAKAMFRKEIWLDEDKLCGAATQGDVGRTKRLLSSGMLDVNCQWHACSSGCEAGARGKGNCNWWNCNCNWGNCNWEKVGLTPLGEAATNGHKVVVKLLLDERAEVDTVNAYGQTPLQLACDRGTTEVVRILLEQGADPNKGCPLQFAINWGQTDMVQILLEGGADPNKQGAYGWMPLYNAGKGGHLDIVKVLLTAGAIADMTYLLFNFGYDLDILYHILCYMG